MSKLFFSNSCFNSFNRTAYLSVYFSYSSFHTSAPTSALLFNLGLQPTLMRRLTFVFLFGIAISQSGAQTPLYSHFKLFKVEDGLPQSFVSGLTQDQDGFFVDRTRDGLARHDGRKFKVFRHDNNDSTSLSSNVILDLYLDPQGDLR